MSRIVTLQNLTSDQVREVAEYAYGSLYLDCLNATTVGPAYAERRMEARLRIVEHLNQRKR